jgi:hypothetical protein
MGREVGRMVFKYEDITVHAEMHIARELTEKGIGIHEQETQACT